MSLPALRLVEGSSMDKSKALDAALSQIERNFGKGSIMRLGKNNKSMDVDTVSTGSLGLDIALGIGGLPRGRIIEIYGPNPRARPRWRCIASPKPRRRAASAPSSMPNMRSTRSMRENSASMSTIFLISQPDAGEQALEIADAFMRSGAVDVLVINSVAALVPRAELEGVAAETENVIANAMAKLRRKGCDLIIANSVAEGTSTFGGETNQVQLIDARSVESWPPMTKAEVANGIVRRLAVELAKRQ